MMHRVRLVMLAVVVLPGLVACGTQGSPNAGPTATEAKLFDPCIGIPDAALTAAGVDPGTQESGVAGVHQHGWEICGWKGNKYSITVYSSSDPADEVVHKSGHVAQRAVTFGGRVGTEFRSEAWETECDAVFSAAQGSFNLQVSGRVAEHNSEDPCAVLDRVANSIVPVLPN